MSTEKEEKEQKKVIKELTKEEKKDCKGKIKSILKTIKQIRKLIRSRNSNAFILSEQVLKEIIVLEKNPKFKISSHYKHLMDFKVKIQDLIKIYKDKEKLKTKFSEVER